MDGKCHHNPSKEEAEEKELLFFVTAHEHTLLYVVFQGYLNLKQIDQG